MRPTYETAQDVEHEQQVIDLLCKAWNCTANKTPKFYCVDWSVGYGNEVKAMVEIKFRNASYPTYILSMHKFTEMCKSAEASRLPFLLVVCWPEQGQRVVKYVEVKHDLHKRVILGGRRDRGDWQDVEPLVEIDASKFKTVGVL